jgi:hypothetical protein
LEKALRRIVNAGVDHLKSGIRKPFGNNDNTVIVGIEAQFAKQDPCFPAVFHFVLLAIGRKIAITIYTQRRLSYTPFSHIQIHIKPTGRFKPTVESINIGKAGVVKFFF